MDEREEVPLVSPLSTNMSGNFNFKECQNNLDSPAVLCFLFKRLKEPATSQRSSSFVCLGSLEDVSPSLREASSSLNSMGLGVVGAQS